MTKKFLLLTTIILSSSLYSQATTTGTIKLINGRVYPNAKVVLHNKDKNVIAEFECGKRNVFKESEISEIETKPPARWKTQEECDQAEEEARQAAEKRKEEKRLKEEQRQQELALKKQAEEKRKQEEARRKEEKKLQEEQRRQELALKKQECEDKGDLWNGRDCRKKSVIQANLDKNKWNTYSGNMEWDEALAYCANLGMRLPTVVELTAAHNAGIIKSWKDQFNTYWYYRDEINSGYQFIAANNGKENGISIYSPNGSGGFRCIRSEETNTNTELNRWSEYQGAMNWEKARGKCAGLGMRLPTMEESIVAHKAGVWRSWQKGNDLYWTSEEFSTEDAYLVSIKGGGVIYFSKASVDGHVRCIH